MNISNINFNLLKALNALLQEKNVSKAGAKVGITQSAMSISLKQLREIYQDELLVRGQKGQMTLTSFAKNLIQPVRSTLRSLDDLFIAKSVFDPFISTRTFRIGMSDYIAFVLLPKLMHAIQTIAPNIKIVQYALNHLEDLQPFEELDMVIGDFQKAPASLKTIQLFVDKGVIVADKYHPAFRGNFTIEKLLAYPQVFVALESQPEENFIARMLQQKGHEVKISLMTPHTLIALQVLPGTLLMTNTVTRLATPFLKPLELAMKPTPFELRQYHARLYWHMRENNEPGHRWLRQLIKDLFQ